MEVEIGCYRGSMSLQKHEEEKESNRSDGNRYSHNNSQGVVLLHNLFNHRVSVFSLADDDSE